MTYQALDVQNGRGCRMIHKDHARHGHVLGISPRHAPPDSSTFSSASLENCLVDRNVVVFGEGTGLSPSPPPPPTPPQPPKVGAHIGFPSLDDSRTRLPSVVPPPYPNQQGTPPILTHPRRGWADLLPFVGHLAWPWRATSRLVTLPYPPTRNTPLPSSFVKM